MTKEQKHGEVAWSDNSYSEKQGGKDLYLKLKPGSNVVRLVTLPYQYYMHKFKFEGEKGFGHRIYCSGAHGSCAVCETGDKPKRRWLVGVVERKENKYKVLDMGWAVYKEIQGYNRDEDWGDPSAYDIDIVVNPHAPPISYYSTVPKPKKNLTAKDIELKEGVDTEYLIYKTAAPEPEKTKEVFDRIRKENEVAGGSGGRDDDRQQSGSSSGYNAPPARRSEPAMTRPAAQAPAPVEDDDTDFPDYDQKDAGF